ncbi:MAG: PAS domain S-box protein [Ferruginibacter sp.]|nr:PAS domain S-box protein [Ferruginibacter sp.]
MQIIKTKRNITIIYLAVALFIGVLLVFFYQNMIKMQTEKESIVSSIERLDKVQHLLLSIETLEQTRREYISTGSDQDEKKYLDAEKNLITAINVLESEIKSNPEIINDFKSVKDNINTYFDVGKNIGLMQKSQSPPAGTRFSEEKKLDETLHEIRKRILALENKYSRNLTESANSNKSLFLKRTGQLIIIGLIFFVLLGLSYIAISRDFNRKKEKEKVLKFNSSIVQSISDAVIITNVEYHITTWNKYAEKIFGYTPEEAIGKNIIDFLKITSENNTIDEIIYDFNIKGEWKGQLINYGKDNQKVYVDVVCSAIKDETGRVIGGVNVIRDITDRILNEIKLNELSHYLENEIKTIISELNFTNERFNLLSKATNDALWDWNIEENKIWCNESFYNMTGIATGTPIEISDFVSMLNEEDRIKIKTSIEDAEKKHSTYTSVEYSIHNKNNVNVNILSRSYIVYNEQEKAVRILGSLQDITLSKKIQDQILFEKELSDTVINSLPGIFYMFNDKLEFIRWNKNFEKITGYQTHEMGLINPVDFVPPEQQDLISEKISNVFKMGEDNVEADLLTKDKKRVPYFFTGMSISYNGQPCMMGVGIDVSEKKKSQEELRRLTAYLQNIREEERSRIAREIHDDLGQQLTGLKMEMSWIFKK